jgi:hypothetical protein
MATVASVSPALQRLRSEVQAANAPRINGDAMVRCCRIAIGFFKVVVEIPYWRGGDGRDARKYDITRVCHFAD